MDKKSVTDNMPVKRGCLIRTLELFHSNMMKEIPALLSDKSIMEYNKKGLLIEQPLTDTQIQPNSVDLTLGDTWKRTQPNDVMTFSSNTFSFSRDPVPFINTKKPMQYKEGTFPEFYTVDPGEFVLMASNEILNIPNGLVSFICGRSSIARLAIQTEQAGFIDAGFRGTITLEVYNQGDYPIRLYKGMRVAQVYFLKAEQAVRLYGKEKGSKYNGQISATESRVHLDHEFQK